MKKRMIAVIIMLAMLIALFPATAQAGSLPVALGTTRTFPEEGVTYTISSQDELAHLAEMVNGGEGCGGNYFVLTQDIALSNDYYSGSGNWTPIGSGTYNSVSGEITSVKAFNGAFYGQNHTISGLDIQFPSAAGLFGYIGSNGTVTDLTVSGTLECPSCAGGITGINFGKIFNCVNEASFSNSSVNAYRYIGGIAGLNIGTLQNCTNNGAIACSINGDSNIGGVVGFCIAEAKVFNCCNTGAITGFSNIGGIVGCTTDAEPGHAAAIRNCNNKGSITGYKACGGIAGIIGIDAYLGNCYTTGSITVTEDDCAGALVGGMENGCIEEYCYYLEGTFTKQIGQSNAGTTITNVYSFDATGTLAAEVYATTSLTDALNLYVSWHLSYPLIFWTGTNTPILFNYVFAESPADVNVAPGKTVDFTVLAAGSYITYRWQVSTDGGSTWNNVTDGYGATTPTYTIPVMTESMDGYQYCCMINNDEKSEAAKLTMQVAAPDIKTQPQSKTVTAGSTASFTVTADGIPAPTYQWQVSKNNGSTWSNVTTGKGGDTKTYTTQAATITMNGYKYRCVATNAAGNDTSNAATLTVVSVYTITAISGNSSYGSVSGSGSYKQGASVKLKATAKSGYYFAGWYKGTLVCANATYTFAAKENITLKAQFDKVGIPATITAKSAGYNKISLSWGAASGAKGYRVYRATSANGTYKMIKSLTGKSLTDSGLNTGTKYYYKVLAYTLSGSAKVYGKYYSAVVSAVPTLAKVTGFKASAVKPTGAKLSWRAVAGKTKYEVWRSLVKDSGYKVVKTIASASFKDTGLTAGKTYYYKVRAYRTVSGKKVYGAYSDIKFIKL
jgi:hypothetical protein